MMMMMMFFFLDLPTLSVTENTVATGYRSLGRCPGFSCGSTPNRLLGPWDGARGFPADPHPKPHIARQLGAPGSLADVITLSFTASPSFNLCNP